MLDEDDVVLEDRRPLRTKADVDTELGLMPYERRLGMVARRAANTFSWQA